MKKTMNAFVVTDKDGVIILTGDNKKNRKLALVEEPSVQFPALYHYKANAEQAIREKKKFEFTRSANTYSKLYGVNMGKIQENLVVKPATVTVEYEV